MPRWLEDIKNMTQQAPLSADTAQKTMANRTRQIDEQFQQAMGGETEEEKKKKKAAGGMP